MEEPIRIAAHDPAWVQSFERERGLIAEAIGTWLTGPIEHIGSTAVPGLAAKPVVDIMAAVRGLEESRPAIKALRALQYCYFPYRPDAMHWFCKPGPGARTHHLHLVPFGSALWIERLAFRDVLRANPGIAAEYAELKAKLAVRFRNDREAYTDVKAPFIARVLREHAPVR